MNNVNIKEKKNSLFCGIHSRTLNPIKVYTLTDIYDCTDLSGINNIIQNIELSKSNNFNKTIIQNLDQILLDKKNNKKHIKDSVKNNNEFINNFEKKQKINKQKELDKNEEIIKKKIIKIQSYYRMYEIRRRYLCINKIDCITLETIFDISPIYLYIFKQKDINKSYAYDIRYLNKLINITKEKNTILKHKVPLITNLYTGYVLNTDEINNIISYIKKIEIIGYTINIKNNGLTSKQIFCW